MTEMLAGLPNFIAGAAAVSAWMFVVVYASFSQWRTTAPGRSLMGAMAALAALLTMNTVHLITGFYAGQTAVRIIVYTVLMVSIVRLFFTLIGILRGNHRPLRITIDKE
jgi:hypothetical protein